mgnify:CR=1 FL=1
MMINTRWGYAPPKLIYILIPPPNGIIIQLLEKPTRARCLN